MAKHPATPQRLASGCRPLLSSSLIVTCVEHTSTALPGEKAARLRHRAIRLASPALAPATALLATVTIAMTALVAFTFTQPASAESLGTARAQASQISAQLARDAQIAGIDNERYDQAELHYQQVSGQLAAARSSLARARAQVDADQAQLRAQAVNAYVTGGESTGLTTLFASPSLHTSVAQEYLNVASGNLQESVDGLHQAETHLSAVEGTLASVQSQARSILAAAAAARSAGQAALLSEQATLAAVKGRIARLVAAQQASEQAVQQASFTRIAAPASAQQVNLPPVQGAARAVAADESQVGVPYVWGGDTPGVGFDCSGLTMWAWGQAGVSLTHSAAAQYGEVTHIPFADIQPGDLLFWASGGYIDHVAMYIGNGDVVNAPYTGQTIRIQPVWTSGLVGAGRP